MTRLYWILKQKHTVVTPVQIFLNICNQMKVLLAISCATIKHDSLLPLAAWFLNLAIRREIREVKQNLKTTAAGKERQKRDGRELKDKDRLSHWRKDGERQRE